MPRLQDTLYAKYIKDREGLEILEDEFSFVTFKMFEKECFLANICIDPDSRTQGRGRRIIDHLGELARTSGCEYISANVDLRDPNSSTTLLAALKVGFKPVRAQADIIHIVKPILGGG